MLQLPAVIVTNQQVTSDEDIAKEGTIGNIKGLTRSFKDKFQIARCEKLYDLVREKNIEKMDPEIIQNNIPMKFYLNVQGPNPYFISGSFLLQVEELKNFEYSI